MTNQPLCAVDNCESRGRPQICFYDGKYHHHGMIHYSGGRPEHSVTFREGWHKMCEEHYQLLKAEREDWLANRTASPAGNA